MGIYVNPNNAAFEMSRFSNIYVDKSMLISRMNAAYRTEQRFICVSRPRRFGKSMAGPSWSGLVKALERSESHTCAIEKYRVE